MNNIALLFAHEPKCGENDDETDSVYLYVSLNGANLVEVVFKIHFLSFGLDEYSL